MMALSSGDMPFNYDVVIVGGGLTGLTAATCLVDAGQRIKVLEASTQIGGRIQSMLDPVTGACLGDLGPTWVWPAAQPLAADWLRRIGADMFPQFDIGETIVEQNRQSAPMRYRLPGMHDSYRIVGGTKAIIDRLAGALPPDAIATGARVTSVSLTGDGVEVLTNSMDCSSLRTRHVIIAVPVRIAAATINWSPALPAQMASAMVETPTWMAAQAKAIAVYDRPFWRDQGLSGRLASQVGPLVEAHDHSGPDGTPAALFGFIGWPHDIRRRSGENLRELIIGQLVHCFGSEACNPQHFRIKDWAQNTCICAPLDLREPAKHPNDVPAVIREVIGDNRIHFAVAEIAKLSPGLIEGAFAAGQNVAKRLLAALDGEASRSVGRQPR